MVSVPERTSSPQPSRVPGLRSSQRAGLRRNVHLLSSLKHTRVCARPEALASACVRVHARVGVCADPGSPRCPRSLLSQATSGTSRTPAPESVPGHRPSVSWPHGRGEVPAHLPLAVSPQDTDTFAGQAGPKGRQAPTIQPGLPTLTWAACHEGAGRRAGGPRGPPSRQVLQTELPVSYSSPSAVTRWPVFLDSTVTALWALEMKPLSRPHACPPVSPDLVSGGGGRRAEAWWSDRAQMWKGILLHFRPEDLQGRSGVTRRHSRLGWERGKWSAGSHLLLGSGPKCISRVSAQCPGTPMQGQALSGRPLELFHQACLLAQPQVDAAGSSPHGKAAQWLLASSPGGLPSGGLDMRALSRFLGFCWSESVAL